MRKDEGALLFIFLRTGQGLFFLVLFFLFFFPFTYSLFLTKIPIPGQEMVVFAS